MSAGPSTAGSGSPAPKARWTARLVVVAGIAAVLVAGAFGVRWWTHPAVFEGLGDSYRADPRPVARAAMSTAVTFPQVDGEPETVTLRDLRAVFSKNTAEATATFSICHLGAGELPVGGAHDPEAFCDDLEPARNGAPFLYGVLPDSDYLLVTVTPSRPGVAHLTRVAISYQRGADHLYQRGTQSLRVDRRITAQ